ncbi:glycoside hydrolase family 108 protein [Maritalea sp. S77]|uniref:glycoside hydrolase family 108 protein n=1 Tax=Maritalea sp. S77 TaxID=3415125 RepID=UPI003C7C0AF1
MNSFQAALVHIFAQEGGYVDHPHDPGGATKYGITRATLARFRNIKPAARLPKSAVRRLRKSEAAQIYHQYYWSPIWATKLPAGIAFCLFDFAVNSGPSRALKTLQSIVQAPQDGRMGPVTMAATTTFINTRTEVDLIKQLSAARLRFLKRLRHYPIFARGWRRRVAETEIRARKIARSNLHSSKQIRNKMISLQGYKTYITAALMLLIGLAQLSGIEVPAFDGTNTGQLIMEAFAIIFLRKGLKETAFG